MASIITPKRGDGSMLIFLRGGEGWRLHRNINETSEISYQMIVYMYESLLKMHWKYSAYDKLKPIYPAVWKRSCAFIIWIIYMEIYFSTVGKDAQVCGAKNL